MRNLFSAVLILVFGLSFGQRVGINTSSPQATLDVTGFPTDVTKIDGMAAPRLSKAQLNAKASVYGTSQTGAMVYINNFSGASVTSTALINSIGYYYFDGAVWKSLDVKTGSTIFIATLGNGNGSSNNLSLPSNGFNTVRLPTVTKNIGGGVWNTTDNTYQIPVSGTYVIKSSVRLVDASTSRNFFQAVGTTNADIPEGMWQTNPAGGNRWTMAYDRIAYFNQGDLIRLYIYSDNAQANISDASLNVTLLSAN